MDRTQYKRDFSRLARLSTWRLLALIATDERWSPLFDSFSRRTPESRFTKPLPWFAWHAMPILEHEVSLREGETVLEWGTGASSLWYVNQGMSVIGIEHDRQWHAECVRWLPTADIRYTELDVGYENPDVDFAQVSIAVIDGRRREECARTISHHFDAGRLRKGALVILDDSNRKRYEAAFDLLAARCQKHRTYTGPTSVEIDKSTSLFWF